MSLKSEIFWIFLIRKESKDSKRFSKISLIIAIFLKMDILTFSEANRLTGQRKFLVLQIGFMTELQGQTIVCTFFPRQYLETFLFFELQILYD